ncbi:MAG: S41 family peptidase [Butyrivibrio sp.]|nr:S41 family peptidase [Acetatifactor muris]MCM1559215.1 S41 family peptidase [Butyrivibrio sp.]
MEENENWRRLCPSNNKPVEKEKNSDKSFFFIGLVAGIATALLVVAIGWLGIELQKVSESQNNGGVRHVELDEDSALDSNTIAKLQALAETIDKYFFLHEVTDEEMRDGMYKGLLASLGDPYSEYYTAEELSSLMQDSEGIYYGIGAYVQLDSDTGLPKISGVIAGSPAEEANLRADDLIYEIDGTSTYGLNLTEAVALIKGPEGTEVEITLIREGESDYVKKTLTRRRVESPTVEFSMLEDDMAYIRVVEFDDVTVDQFADALAMAKGSDAKGIILDLRGNPGGNLRAVVDMCNMILPEGMIVYTEDKYGNREEYKSDGEHELELPLVVLVDMNSASAAEIMAGAIKDYGIGTLVGTTTFGKGIVQQIMSFRDGSAIKITISAYYTPNGNNIHGIGIVPDVVCEFDGEAYYGSPEHPDNQLEKAKDVLREKMGR